MIWEIIYLKLPLQTYLNYFINAFFVWFHCFVQYSYCLEYSVTGVGSVPVMTSLQSTSDIGRYVSTLHSEAARFTIKKHHHFLEAGLEEEEYTETLHSLHNLAECYSLT